MVMILYSGLAVLLLVLAYILYGAAFETLWGWFIVPLGAPDIGIVHAIGIVTLIGLLTHTDDSVKRDRKGTGPMVSLLLRPVLCVIIGRIALSFM